MLLTDPISPPKSSFRLMVWNNLLIQYTRTKYSYAKNTVLEKSDESFKLKFFILIKGGTLTENACKTEYINCTVLFEGVQYSAREGMQDRVQECVP